MTDYGSGCDLSASTGVGYVGINHCQIGGRGVTVGGDTMVGTEAGFWRGVTTNTAVICA